MPVSPEEFRQALGHFASGVTVVTTRDADGEPQGLTVSAFCSVSLNPPMVLVCIDKTANCYKAFADSGVYVVNILSLDQELISRRLASKEPNKFEGVAYRLGIENIPVLDGVLASVECRVVSLYEGGDHTILVGKVENVMVRDGEPLLYFRGGYVRLTV